MLRRAANPQPARIELRSASSFAIQCRELFVGELDIDRGDVLLQMGNSRYARDR
jgi:hypothetical protein